MEEQPMPQSGDANMGSGYTPPPTQYPQQKKSGLWWKILLPVIGVLLLGGVAFGYYFVYMKPETVVLRAFGNMANTKTLTFEADIEAEMEQNMTSLFSPTSFLFSGLNSEDVSEEANHVIVAHMGLNGKVDGENKNSPKVALDMHISGSEKGKDEKMEFSFSVISMNTSTLYVKLGNLPDMGFFDLSSAENKWFKVDFAQLGGALGMQPLMQKVEETNKAKRSSEDQKKIDNQIRNILVKNTPIRVTKVLSSEKVNGVKFSHYAYEYAESNFGFAVEHIKQIPGLTQEEKKKWDDVRTSLNDLDNLRGELWINRDNMTISRMTLETETKDKFDFRSLSMKADVKITGLNRIVAIEEPADATDVMQMFNDMMSGYDATSTSMNYLTSTSSEELGVQYSEPIDTDGDGLSDTTETFWGSDINKVDTDGDGYGDYEEVMNGYNPNGDGMMADAVLPTP